MMGQLLDRRAEGGSILCSRFFSADWPRSKTECFYEARKRPNKKTKTDRPTGPSLRTSSTPLITAFSSITISVWLFWVSVPMRSFVGQTPQKVWVIHADQLKDQGLQIGHHEALKSALQAL